MSQAFERVFANTETTLREVIESIPQGIAILDAQGKIVLTSPEFERIFQYDRGELVEQSITLLIPELAPTIYHVGGDSLGQIPSSQHRTRGEFRARRKDGSHLGIEIAFSPLTSQATPLVVASVVDVTDKRRPQDWLYTVIECVPTGIIMVDHAGMIVLSNLETEKMFGYGPGELIGKKVETIVPHRYRASHPMFRQEFSAQPLKRQMGAGRDLAGLRKDGREIHVEIGLNPIRMNDSDFVLASIVDITERKKTETEFVRIHEEVQRRNQEMEQFVFTVSHDLKAPLVTSLSFLNFLNEDLATGNFEACHKSLQCVERAQRRMQQLIEDLLRVSRLGSMELQLANVDVRELVETVVQSLAEHLRQKHLIVELGGALPVIAADYNRFQQVIENLITNAMKYATTGPDPRLRIFSKDAGDNMLVCVKDNGPGIDKQYHKKIFDLFQRLDNVEEGTGVGLTIVSRAMQLHGGSVWVESEPGQGCEFWLSFPKRSLREE